MASQQSMTKTERDEIGRLVRRRERYLKTEARERSTHLLAEFERHLGAVYSWDDDATWQEASRQARAAIADADAVIARRCEALGIPKEFRPSAHFGWRGRGQNGTATRRVELRAMAKTDIAAKERTAFQRIERWSLETQERLVAPALTSKAASEFLASVPPLESVMPEITERDVRVLIGA